MSKNIYAYTAPGANYPEYVSLNHAEPNTDHVVLTVRGPPVDGAPGAVVEVVLSGLEFLNLRAALRGGE